MAVKIMYSAVSIARQATDDHNSMHGTNCKVALSLGPYAACLYPVQEYTGRYPPPFGPINEENTSFPDTEEGRRLEEVAIQNLSAFHLDRLRIFTQDQVVWNSIDCVAFETVPLAREVTAIRKAVKDLEHELGRTLEKPWWISFVLPEGRSSQTLPSGEHLMGKDMAKAALNFSSELALPTAIGVNCTGPSVLGEAMESISEFLKTLGSPIDLVVYPNSGEVYCGDGKWSGEREGWQDAVLEACANIDHKFIGRVVVGGCCRTGPRDIQQFRAALEKRQ
jgi:homocysteine S-methyltransferase